MPLSTDLRAHPRTRRTISRAVRFVSAAALAVLAACGSDSGGPAGPSDPGTPKPVARVDVAPGAGELEPGVEMALTATPKAADGTPLGRAVAWSSSNAAVVTVTAAGVVKAVGEGTATVSATAEGRTGEARFTVRAGGQVPTPVIARLTPGSVAAGGPDFTLTIEGAGFRENAGVLWNGRLRVATVVSETRLTARILAEEAETFGRVEVKVVNPGGRASEAFGFDVVRQEVPVASVQVRPAVAVTRPGSPVPFSVKLYDGRGNALEGRRVTWSSSNLLVATVNGDGVVTAVGAGEATITAASEGRTAQAALVVTANAFDLVLDGANEGLFLLDLRLGGAPVRAWHHGTIAAASDPSPSPDRTRWAYVHLHTNTTTPSIAIFHSVNRTYEFRGQGDQPAWSPAGERIAFRSTRSGRADLWVINADGTGEKNLTPDVAGDEGGAVSHPAWSPDGTRIVFSRRNTFGGTDLWTVNADGTQLARLVSSEHPLTEAAWSPNGEWIVVTRTLPDGSSDLMRMHRNGGQRFALTHTGDARMAAWSPDSRWIAFVRRAGTTGKGDVMAMRMDDFQVFPLTLRTDGPAGGGLNPAFVRRW